MTDFQHHPPLQHVEHSTRRSTLPMHMFLLKWSEWVALHRFPAWSARLRELEKVVGQAGTGGEARAAAAEIGRLLAAAGEEAAGR